MKLVNSDAKRFPKLVKHLQTEFPKVLEKGVIVKGLESAGIDYKDAVIYTTYGYDPLVDVRTMPSGDIMGWKILSRLKGVPQTYGMQISTGLVKKFIKGDDLTTFSIAGTIRLIDATLLLMLVCWRKVVEVGGLISSEDAQAAVYDFKDKAIGEAQAIVNPFL